MLRSMRSYKEHTHSHTHIVHSIDLNKCKVMIACVSRSINTHVFEYVYIQFIIQFVQFFLLLLLVTMSNRVFFLSLGACFGEVLKVLMYKHYNNKGKNPPENVLQSIFESLAHNERANTRCMSILIKY